MGMRQLAGIHPRGSVSQFIITGITCTHPLLGDVLQGRIRLEREPTETVQPTSCPYGRWFHHVQRIL